MQVNTPKYFAPRFYSRFFGTDAKLFTNDLPIECQLDERTSVIKCTSFLFIVLLF